MTQIDSSINEKLKPEISLMDEETFKIKEELELINEQIQILDEAEDEVSAKLEYLMESKKRDIYRSLNKALKLNGGEVDTKKIHRFAVIRDKKESSITMLLNEKQKIENEYMDKCMNYELEETKIKAKILKIEENIENQKKTKKQMENYAKQLKVIENTPCEDDTYEIHIFETPKKGKESETEKENSEILENSEKSDEENQKIEEIKEEQLERSLTVTLSQPSSLNFDLEETNSQEKQFFQSISPLLNGSTLYKKLTQRKSLNVGEYDPLEPESPEVFGYAVRNLKLIKSLTKIEIRHLSKPGIENSIMVEMILAPVIPKHTAEMIKAQKKNWLNESKDNEITPAVNKKYREMKNSGLLNYNDSVFKIKSKEANTYPFFITLEKGGRIELIATGYSVFKQWIEGINSLIKFKKQLARLRYKIS